MDLTYEYDKLSKDRAQELRDQFKAIVRECMQLEYTQAGKDQVSRRFAHFFQVHNLNCHYQLEFKPSTQQVVFHAKSMAATVILEYLLG